MEILVSTDSEELQIMSYLTRILAALVLTLSLISGGGCAVTRPHHPQTIPDNNSDTPSTYPRRTHAGPRPWFWVIGIILGVAIVD